MNNKFIIYLFFISGILFFLFGLYKNIDQSIKKKTYILTEGVVIEYNTERDYERSNVISYTVNGEEFIVSDNKPKDIKKVGEKEEVYYNPNNPKESFIKNNNNFLIMLLGISFILCSIFMNIKYKTIIKDIKQNNIKTTKKINKKNTK